MPPGDDQRGRSRHAARHRTLPESVAGVVQELELRQTTLPEKALADRLVRLGWLLPLRKRSTWEFAPAARAGRYSSGDPWIELRALLEHEPDAPVALAFDSAVWELGHSTHQPTRPILAHRRGWRAPKALDVRLVTFEWTLPTKTIRGLPVCPEATVVVAAAERPGAPRDWANADEWLPETFGAVTPEEVLTEAKGRKVSTLARLGYLAEWAGRDDVADEIEALLPRPLPVTSLGSRDRRDRWNRRWHLYDALLPRR